MTEKIIAVLAKIIVGVISSTGYFGVAALMAIESACIPLPSEIIMPFAGYLTYTGRLSLFWVATAGAIGCNLGSVIAYEIGHYGGRPLVERYGRWILMGKRELDWADRFFARQSLLLRRRWPSWEGSLGTSRRSGADVGSAASRVRPTENREGPGSGNKDGLVTRRPVNCDHATPDVGHDAASGRLVHLCSHHLNLITDYGHKRLRTFPRPAVSVPHLMSRCRLEHPTHNDDVVDSTRTTRR